MATEWFLECNPELNEQVASILAEHGLAAQSAYTGLQFSDKKSRDVWLIPSHLVRKIIIARKSNPQFTYKFFTRSSPGAKLQQANFFVLKRHSAKMKKAMKELAELRKRKGR